MRRMTDIFRYQMQDSITNCTKTVDIIRNRESSPLRPSSLEHENQVCFVSRTFFTLKEVHVPQGISSACERTFWQSNSKRFLCGLGFQLAVQLLFTFARFDKINSYPLPRGTAFVCAMLNCQKKLNQGPFKDKCQIFTYFAFCIVLCALWVPKFFMTHLTPSSFRAMVSEMSLVQYYYTTSTYTKSYMHVGAMKSCNTYWLFETLWRHLYCLFWPEYSANPVYCLFPSSLAQRKCLKRQFWLSSFGQ